MEGHIYPVYLTRLHTSERQINNFLHFSKNVQPGQQFQETFPIDLSVPEPQCYNGAHCPQIKQYSPLKSVSG